MDQKKKNTILGIVAGVALLAAAVIVYISTRPATVEQDPPTPADAEFQPRPNRGVAPDADLPEGVIGDPKG